LQRHQQQQLRSFFLFFFFSSFVFSEVGDDDGKEKIDGPRAPPFYTTFDCDVESPSCYRRRFIGIHKE
jgi:hypothetical protein